MSLVDEAVISVLNRRFVSCYWNTFEGPGHDPAAATFAKGLGQLEYGAIVTPDGELVRTFGFDRLEVFLSFLLALLDHPEYARWTDDEKRILQEAERDVSDVGRQLAAARLCGEVLDFARAEKFVARALEHASTNAWSARARYARAHLWSINLGHHEPSRVRAELDRIVSPPADIADDIALDRMGLDLQLRPRGVFFTGWRFLPKVDLTARAAELETWIRRAPTSNRRGQMLFLLGLCRMDQGDRAAADAAWSRHVADLPQDRHAVLSRIHTTTYRFSPYSGRVSGTQKTSSEVSRRVKGLARKISAHGVELRFAATRRER